MNEALNIGRPHAFDAASLSMMRRLRGDAAAANEDACVDTPVTDEIDAWARHASAAGGFGDAMVATPAPESRPTSPALHRDAHLARAKALGGLVAAGFASLRAALRRAYASYRMYRDAADTARVLRGLDDRTLHDLGYHRSEIDSVAIETSIARAR